MCVYRYIRVNGFFNHCFGHLLQVPAYYDMCILNRFTRIRVDRVIPQVSSILFFRFVSLYLAFMISNREMSANPQLARVSQTTEKRRPYLMGAGVLMSPVV